MNLLIDLGNTRLKWAWSSNHVLQDISGVRHRGEDFLSILQKNFSLERPPNAVTIASVAGPEKEKILKNFFLQSHGIEPTFLKTSTSYKDLRNAYHEPSDLGIDRWLAMVAVREHHKETFAVIDCGTALTIDVVTADGQHQGGCIAPGLELLNSALTQITDGRLGLASSDRISDDLLGTSTLACLEIGFYRTTLGFLNSVIAELKVRYPDLSCYFTGGDGERWQKKIDHPSNFDPHLVLKGLQKY